MVSLILAKKYAKSEKSQTIFLKTIAVCLFISILTNRLSQVFRYDDVRWYLIIPESYCGMTSLVLSLAVIYLRVYFVGMPALMLYNFGAMKIKNRMV